MLNSWRHSSPLLPEYVLNSFPCLFFFYQSIAVPHSIPTRWLSTDNESRPQCKLAHSYLQVGSLSAACLRTFASPPLSAPLCYSHAKSLFFLPYSIPFPSQIFIRAVLPCCYSPNPRAFTQHILFSLCAQPSFWPGFTGHPGLCLLGSHTGTVAPKSRWSLLSVCLQWTESLQAAAVIFIKAYIV